MKKEDPLIKSVPLWHRLMLGIICILMILFVIWAGYKVCIHESEALKQEIVTVLLEPIESEPNYISDAEFATLYTLKDEVINDTCLTFSVEDAERLMKIAVVEDYTSIESQANVMKVILNRVASPNFPNTIQEVIEQEGQFSTVSNGSYAKAVPNVNSHYALALIEAGEVETDALFFEAAWAKNTWQSTHLTYVSTVGGTKYYK